MLKITVFLLVSLFLLSRAIVSFGAETHPPQSYKIMAKAESDYNERVREEWLKGNKLTPDLRKQIKEEIYKLADEQYKNEKRKESSYIRELVRSVLEDMKKESPKKSTDDIAEKKPSQDKKEVKTASTKAEPIVEGSAQPVSFSRSLSSDEKSHEDKSLKSDGGAESVTFRKANP